MEATEIAGQLTLVCESCRVRVARFVVVDLVDSEHFTVCDTCVPDIDLPGRVA